MIKKLLDFYNKAYCVSKHHMDFYIDNDIDFGHLCVVKFTILIDGKYPSRILII